MTCIAGMVHDGHVWIGGDSAGVAGYSLTVRADAKVWNAGPFVFGFTTSFRMGQLLRHTFSPPERQPTQDVDAYLCGPFIDAVRDCLKAGGFSTVTDGAERGGTFLIGYAGRLFQIGNDYQVAESAHGFDAIGCGDELALGALAATTGTPTDRIRSALEVAEMFSAGVRGPFHIVCGGAADGTPQGIQGSPTCEEGAPWLTA